jgi:hypothetical protein
MGDTKIVPIIESIKKPYKTLQENIAESAQYKHNRYLSPLLSSPVVTRHLHCDYQHQTSHLILLYKYIDSYCLYYG